MRSSCKRVAIFLFAMLCSPVFVVAQLPPREAAKSPQNALTRMRIAQELADRIAAGDFEHAETAFDNALARVLPPPELMRVCNLCASNSSSKPVFQAAGFSYNGRLSKSPQDFVHVMAVRRQGNVALQLEFGDENLIVGISISSQCPGYKQGYKPPPYDRPDAYAEIDVDFGLKNWPVRGKLTLPRAATEGYYEAKIIDNEGEHRVIKDPRVPAVILFQGFGMGRDMDYSEQDIRPFRDVACGLASNGVAVLRYEPRVFGHRAIGPDASRMSIEQFLIDDAVEAIRFVRTQYQIDEKYIFLLGHNVAGSLLPQIADAAHVNPRGLILVGGVPRDLYATLEDHFMVPADKGGTPAAALILRPVRDRRNGKKDPPDNGVQGVLDFNFYILDQMVENIAEAAPLLSHFKGALFIAAGRLDTFSTTKDLELYKAALLGHPDATFHEYEKMGLFMTELEDGKPLCLTRNLPAGHVSPHFIADVADWVHAKAK